MSEDLSSLFSSSWAYLDPKEADLLLLNAPSTKPTTAREIALAARLIFQVAEDCAAEGKEKIIISSGEAVKLLSDDSEEEWAYFVPRLVISVAGAAYTATLSDVKVAVLPKDYLEIMENRDARIIRRRGAPT